MSNAEISPSSDAEMIQLLKNAKNIAIVGLSNDPSKDSYRVAEYLKKHGYKIIPVNPKYKEVLGEKSYSTLREIPEKIDIVNIFRAPEAVLSLAQETLSLPRRPLGFWMQLGIAHNEAALMLKQQGIIVIEDKCIKIVHSQIGKSDVKISKEKVSSSCNL